MKLEDLGYNSEFEKFRRENELTSFKVGRVISEHKGGYIVKTESSEFQAKVSGRFRFNVKNKSDLPAIGDWVSISEYANNKARIHAIFQRRSTLERKSVSEFAASQIIATNVDYAFVVQSVDKDFNLNRIDRYMTICNSSNIKVYIILTKIDLIKKNVLQKIVADLKKRVSDKPIYLISNKTLLGINKIKEIVKKQKTYCLLGSSGVGKSTLLNNLLDENKMKTGAISKSSKRGKHVTSHRELFVLDGGSIFIDTPGMRELGSINTRSALESTFTKIIEFSQNCKFKDCTHIKESSCALREALETGELDKSVYENYLKMKREEKRLEENVVKKKRKQEKMLRKKKN